MIIRGIILMPIIIPWYRWFGLSNRARKRRPRPSNSRPVLFRPRLEILEERTAPAVRFLPGPLAGATVNPAQSFADSGFTADVVEPLVRVNAATPTQVMLGTQFSWMTSTNNGAGFGTVQQTPYYSDGDIATVFDRAGNLYHVNILCGELPNTPGRCETGIVVTRLDPATGAPLGPTSYVDDLTASTTQNDDKPFLAVDPNLNSNGNYNLYCSWAQFDSTIGAWQILVSFSADQGTTWSSPTLVTPSDIQPLGFAWPSTVAVGPDSTVYVSFHAQPDQTAFDPTLSNPNPTQDVGQVWVVTYQVNNGQLQEMQRALAFEPGNADITFNVQSTSNIRQVEGAAFWTQGSAQTWLLPDPNCPGTVYAVSSDGDDLHGGSFGNVVLATSTNVGQSWSSPAFIVNNNASADSQTDADTLPDQFSFFPTAAIDPLTGTIVVAWYQNYNGAVTNARNARGHYLLDVYATYSTNRGQTWATPFRITSQSTDPDVSVFPDQHTFNQDLIRFSNTQSGYFAGNTPYTTRIGEYFGIDILGNTGYVAWNGNAGTSATSPLLFYTTFGINGALQITGDNIGAGQNNTIQLSLEPGNPAFVVVQVNNTIQYAGLLSTLTGLTITGGAGATNTLAIDCTNGNPIPAGGLTSNNIQDFQTVSCASSSLAVFNTAPATVRRQGRHSGGKLMYTVTIHNNGPAVSTQTVLRDILPAGVRFVSAAFSQGSHKFARGTLTANLGTINPGETVSGTIMVRPRRVGTLTNTVAVVSLQDPAGALATASTLVTARVAVILHNFGNLPDGWQPWGSPTLVGSTLYGYTAYGGDFQSGALFRINTDGSGYQVVHSFGGLAAGPNGTLVPDGMTPHHDSLRVVGNELIGATVFGGCANQGVIYAYNFISGGYRILHQFTGRSKENPNGSTNDGAQPHSNPRFSVSDNVLYGLTSAGGSHGSGDGTLYQVNLDGSGFQVLYRFSKKDGTGYDPHGFVIQIGSVLFGMTRQGGKEGAKARDGGGVIFALDLSTSTYTVLHEFDPKSHSNPTKNDGFGPDHGGLTEVNGYLYGLATLGGQYGHGILFKILPVVQTNAPYKKLHDFAGRRGNDGSGPHGSLVLSPDGVTLFGMTSKGGSADDGTVFSFNTTSNASHVLKSFLGGPSDGDNGLDNVIVFQGRLYGLTKYGGSVGTLAVPTPPAPDYSPASTRFANGTVFALPLLNPTTTTLTSSGNRSLPGQVVTFTATVQGLTPGSSTPQGSVTFRDGTRVLATVALVGGQARFSTKALAIGVHTITATYSGFNLGAYRFAKSTKAIFQVVWPPTGTFAVLPWAKQELEQLVRTFGSRLHTAHHVPFLFPR